MRKIAGLALFALLLLFLAMFLPTQSPAEKKAEGQAAANESRQISFGFGSSQIADAGGRKVAVLGIYVFPEYEKGEVRVFCSAKPLQKNMLVLSHASAPGVDAGLGAAVERELSRCGFSSRRADASDALSSKNAVIISPTGAIPSELAENAAAMLQQNSRAVVLESLAGRLVQQDGSLAEANRSYGFGIVPLAPGEGAKAAREAAMAAIAPRAYSALSFFAAGGNFTVAVPINGTSAACRAIFLSEGGACRSADSFWLEPPPGRLKGPAELLAGERGQFEFSLAGQDEVGRSLRFFASIMDGKRPVSRQEIAGGKISDGWASSFAAAAPEGGRYVLSVSDQFGRVHASAYFESLGFAVTPVSQQGTRLEYYAAFGGRPISGAVEARVDGGEPKQYYSSNGTLVVWAAPPQGRHTMRFSYRGLSAAQEFSAQGSGLLDAYVRLGVPAAAFLLAVFLLLRARGAVKYRITFPEKASAPLRQVESSSDDIAAAWARFDRKIGGFCLPASPEEIAPELVIVLGEKKGSSFSPHSVLQALRSLSEQGVFSESEGQFIPRGSMGGFSAEELGALRLLHDLMLERGIRFRRRRAIPLKGGSLELALFSGKKSVLAGIGKAPRAVVFPSREGLAEFEKSLSSAQDAESVRIKLALSNGKVVFAHAARHSIEPLLP